MKKTKTIMTVAENRQIAAGIYSMLLEYPEGAQTAQIRPGQFVGVYTDDPSRILPRPISICRWDPDKKQIRLVYRISGGGTAVIAAKQPGEKAAMLGILGNGYDTEKLSGKKVVLMGGGIGIPPMLELAASLSGKADVTAVLGYRTNDLFLKEDFEKYCRVVIATDDGTAGVHGTVIDAAKAQGLIPEAVCACGPMPMLRGVKAFAQENGAQCFISLEERMACGIGACLGCVCRTVNKDAHSHVNNTRICTEGPVFNAEDVVI